MFPSQGASRFLPVVVQRSRMLMLFMALMGFVSMSAGLNLRPNHWMVDGLIPGEWICEPMGVLLMVFGIGRALRPPRLTLTAAGLEFQHLLWTRREPWGNVVAVGLRTWRVYRQTGTGVEIRFKSGDLLHLDGEWPESPQTIVQLVEDARREKERPSPSDLRK
jgi:hypothetical protein